MCMRNHPLLHLDAEPEAVDTQGNDRQQKPNDVFAEKLTARTVKAKLLAVDKGVPCVPTLLYAHSPRISETECQSADYRYENVDTDKS